MTLGLVNKNKIFYSKAAGIDKPVIYVGSKTGRDGIHGASMASATYDDKIEEKKPTVQVGDPFTEKLLLEACLELMADNSIIAIQDMGAAGLTSSSVEMASKGKLGIELDLSKVPCREEKMTPYEIMLSESQERMLIVLEKGKEDHAKKIFDKWNLDFAVIGKTTDTKKIELIFDNKKVAEIPIDLLAENAPIYDRKWKKTKLPQKLKFKKDENETCEVKSKNRVIFRRQDHSLSSAALILINEQGYNWRRIAGPKFWMHNGKSLRDLRYELEETGN